MAGKRATKIDSMLRHLAAGGEAQDFPGTKYENLAVARTIVRRGLITWDGEGNRYVLTPAGWNELTPRRFGLSSLVVSTAVGAAIGAAALAFLWLPGARWQDSAHGQPATTLAMQSGSATTPAMQTRVAAPVSAPADFGGRSVAPMSATAPKPAPAARVPATEPSTAAATPAAPVPAAEPTTAAAAPSEPAEIAAQPAAEQPNAEATPASPKQAAVKKHHRRTVRQREQYNPFANQWRGQQYQQTRYGQGSWFAYR
jgi:outer membrane biosynthesis protein TonB